MIFDTLIIAPNFFGYAKAICDELEKGGRHPIWVDDRPGSDFWTKALTRLAPWACTSRADGYFSEIIETVRPHPISEVLVIKGESLSLSSIKRLRTAFPHARFTLYFWDSYENMPSESPQKVDLFDRAFSFDPKDVASDPRLTYRPLFYLPEFAAIKDESRDIDVLFFGTMHSDRYQVVKKVERALGTRYQFKKVLYLPSSLLFYSKRTFVPGYWSAAKDEFTFKPVPRNDLLALMARSKAILDIERPIQSGYTIRTLEILGARRKLLTSNTNVASADFFSPEDVQIFDRTAPLFSTEFFETPLRPWSQALAHKYSLRGWIMDVLPAATHFDGAKTPLLPQRLSFG